MGAYADASWAVTRSVPIRVVLSHSATVWDTRCQGGSVADLA